MALLYSSYNRPCAKALPFMASCTSVAGMLLVASKSCTVIRVLEWKKVGNIPKKSLLLKWSALFDRATIRNYKKTAGLNMVNMHVCQVLI